MKSIIATHTIVFIGYGLGDYNINMLLNWVRKLQKDSFHKPFFIRTEPDPVQIEDAIYYENKGIRIIDAASLMDKTDISYLDRYSKVMDLLIESKENMLITNDNEVINYIYDRISPLFSLQCVRKVDLKYVFENDYQFEINGTVIRNKNKGFGYMERFFEIRDCDDEKFNLSEIQIEKFNAITNFFEDNGIMGMIGDVKEMNVPMGISNLAYHSNYQKMEKYIQGSSVNIKDDYKKAFYLACLGRWEDSYNLYSKVILDSVEESNWCIHYLSHINRYRVYQSITQAVRRFNGIGLLAYGNYYQPFSHEFLSSIEREMTNFTIGDLFSSMPFDFQRSYKILEFLSTNQFLYQDTVKLFELTNKVRSEMNKGSYTIGLSNDEIVYLHLYENSRFLYENFLWTISFSDFHRYVRNSMILLI